ncbi:MAG: type II CRISPR-associated endonuclease Cas1 [Peptostreptococcaceae bacterium]|nr:type II CRISPR-associated endonuclease Cas1 [Peptostreptococcaceae bacterium]
MNYLEVRGDTMTRVHLSEINTLIISNTAVSLTAYLLCELMKQKIKVIFCDEKRNPSSELVSYYGSHDTSAKLRKQVRWEEQAKNLVWTEIVREKISKQMELLAQYEKHETDMLAGYIDELEYRDETNREGHAAKVYFNSLFGMGFSRKSENSINAALNFGYSIILSAFNREIVANGYITQLGIAHDNIYNNFNLGSDFMEPFRPLVDEVVYDMMPEQFGREEKVEILRLLQREVMIGGKKQVVDNAIKIYCKSVLDALDENDIRLIRFYEK